MRGSFAVGVGYDLTKPYEAPRALLVSGRRKRAVLAPSGSRGHYQMCSIVNAADEIAPNVVDQSPAIIML